MSCVHKQQLDLHQNCLLHHEADFHDNYPGNLKQV